MHDIRKSPRLMGSVRLEMESALAKAAGYTGEHELVKWLRGDGLKAVYRVAVESSGDRVEGTLTDLFEHFGLTFPSLWQHALRLQAEEIEEAQQTA